MNTDLYWEHKNDPNKQELIKEFESQFIEPISLIKGADYILYKGDSYYMWLRDKGYFKSNTMQYTQEFEDWWAVNYLNKLSNLQPIMIDSYKEVAYAAWQHQQTQLEEARYIAEEIRADLRWENQTVADNYKFTWE